MTSWEAVGGNPCPGDVGALRSRAAALKAVSDHGGNLHQRLNDLHAGIGDLRWSGEGATAIAAIIEKNVPDLQKLWTSHLDAANALGRYVNHLEDLQRHADAALRDYAQAVADQAAAQADHDHAAGRHSSAQWQVRELTVELKAAQAQRLVAAAAHQPTGALDARIASLQDDISHQSGLAAAAARDMDAAHSRSSSADDRIRNARARIETARQENEDYVRVAAKALLGAVGIVHSNNPAVRLWENVTHGAQTAAKWFDEYGLDIVDNMITALSLVALIAGPFAPAIGTAVVALSVVSFVGHVYRYANHESGETAGSLALSAFTMVPYGRVLGGFSKSGPKAFTHNFPGLVKRLVWTKNATHAKGIFSSSGVRIWGQTVYRVHVVPKQVRGPAWLYKSALVGATAQAVTRMVKEDVEYFEAVKDAFEQKKDPGPASAVPVATLQLQTSGAAA